MNCSCVYIPVSASSKSAAKIEWFVDARAGDLHLTDGLVPAIDQGISIPELLDDYDGQKRPEGSSMDVGADEYLLGVTPLAPTAFEVN